MRRTDAVAVVTGSVLAVSVLAAATMDTRSSALTAAVAPLPSDALAILWADYCGRVEDTRCTLPTPSPSATGTSPASTGTPSAPATASPTPTPTIAVTPTPAPTPTASPTPTQTAPPPGSFIGPEVAGLPTSGKAWDGLMTWAAKTASSPSIGDQDDPDNVIVLAQALVYARTGDAAMRSKVLTALGKVQTSSIGRALALGRELGAYVLAADYIGYRDPAFVSWVSRMRTVATSGGPASLVKCHEQRGNNWGTWCGASRVIADLYLGDSTDLAKAVDVWRGYLGDRAAYAGFSFGDTSWQADPSKPVAINPVGATKGGHSIDGVLPDDQRRGGGFTWPPPCENYVHEALQGVTLALAVLAEARTDLWPASGDAVFRAYSWLYANGCPASGDDTATPWIVNHYTGADFPVTSPTSPGKGFGFTDWLWP